MILRAAPTTALLLILAGCGPDYSPDTYATNAVQQANKVEQGVIVGVRDVAVTAAGTAGALTGGAAGGIAGSQVGVGPVSAFTALGGTLVGGLTGAAVEHATGDTKAFEYIVRKTGSDLVSVTQKDKVPLALGQKVLVIAGNQARVVPDYTVNLTPSAREAAKVEAGRVEAGRVEAGRVEAGRIEAGRAADPGASQAASLPEAAARGIAPAGGASAVGSTGGSTGASPPPGGAAPSPAGSGAAPPIAADIPGNGSPARGDAAGNVDPANRGTPANHGSGVGAPILLTQPITPAEQPRTETTP